MGSCTNAQNLSLCWFIRIVTIGELLVCCLILSHMIHQEPRKAGGLMYVIENLRRFNIYMY
jgi:hypothetical protein